MKLLTKVSRTAFLLSLISFSLISLPSNVFADANAFADGLCPYCGPASNFYNMPFYSSMGYYSMPSFFPSYYPWWGGYGAMAYSNFSYPGAWSGGGMNGGFYPPGGSSFIGKPNLYFSGKAGTEVQVRVKMAVGSKWLVAVPAHGIQGWHGILLSQGKIQVSEKERYDFFFYDFRCDGAKLQDVEGFCTKRDHIIGKLASILRKMGFKASEIKDFETYWNVKLPPSERYCVYPQEGRELDQIAELLVEPKPKKETRIAFMIVPDEARQVSSVRKKFLKVPKKEWASRKNSDPAVEAPAGEDGLEIREWSVGFIQSPGQSSRQ